MSAKYEDNYYIDKVAALRASMGFPDRHRGRTTGMTSFKNSFVHSEYVVHQSSF